MIAATRIAIIKFFILVQGDNGAELLAECFERGLLRGQGKGPGAEVEQPDDPGQDGEEVKCLFGQICHGLPHQP